MVLLSLDLSLQVRLLKSQLIGWLHCCMSRRVVMFCKHKWCHTCRIVGQSLQITSSLQINILCSYRINVFFSISSKILQIGCAWCLSAQKIYEHVYTVWALPNFKLSDVASLRRSINRNLARHWQLPVWCSGLHLYWTAARLHSPLSHQPKPISPHRCKLQIPFSGYRCIRMEMTWYLEEIGIEGHVLPLSSNCF